METKIASYQEPGLRIQLVRIEKEDIGTDGKPTSLTEIKYQIRINRKIIRTTTNISEAKKCLLTRICAYLNQTSLNFEQKKLWKIEMGGKYYIEEKEITKDEYRHIIYNNQNNIGKPIKVKYTEDKRFITIKEVTYEEYKNT